MIKTVCTKDSRSCDKPPLNPIHTYEEKTTKAHMQFSDIKPKIFANSLRPLTQKTEKNQSFKVAMNVVKCRDEVKVSLCLKPHV